MAPTLEIRIRTYRSKCRGRRCWLGHRIDSISCRTIQHIENWRKGWIEELNIRRRIYSSLRFRKMDDHLVHTTPNHHPLKLDVFPKTFLQILLAAKSLVQHSSSFPNQQWRSLPFLLRDSYWMAPTNTSPIEIPETVRTWWSCDGVRFLVYCSCNQQLTRQS